MTPPSVGPERDAQAHDDRVQAEGAPALLGREGRNEHRGADGHRPRTAEALERAEADERPERRRRPAERRATVKTESPAGPGDLAPQYVRQAPRREQKRRNDDEVRDDDPLDLAPQRHAEVSRDDRERHVDDGRVDRRHQHADGDDPEDRPFAGRALVHHALRMGAAPVFMRKRR